MFSETIFATQIRLHKDKKSLSVHFNDGFETQISAELLRVESPSAEVQGHSSYQKKIIRGKKANYRIIPEHPLGLLCRQILEVKI